jgi:hypothetical protein
MNKFEHVVEVVGKDIWHGIEYPFVHTAKVLALLDTAIKDSPKVKQEVLAMIQQAEAVIKDVGLDVSERGVNIPQDMQTLVDVKAFVTYFAGTFVPAMEAIYSEVKNDLNLPDSTPVAS